MIRLFQQSERANGRSKDFDIPVVHIVRFLTQSPIVVHTNFHVLMAPLHCLRFVDVSEWNPASLNWQRLMLQLSSNEQKQVTRFVFSKDQKLALASRLLQRQLIHELFHTNYENIEIKRTPEVRSLNNVAYHYWYLHLCKTANNLCRYLLSLEQTILESTHRKSRSSIVELQRLSSWDHRGNCQ